MNDYLFEMKNMYKYFPGVKALDDVTISVKKGSVHALMGENGAGKSTLMKCAFGIYRADSGSIYMNGKQCNFDCPRNAMDNGLTMIHQELHPINERNIMENVWVGRIPYKKIFGLKFVDNKKMFEDTKRIFDEFEIDLDPYEKVGNLAAAHIQIIEIVKAVSYGAKIVIMDEPTSSLANNEVELLFKIINKLKNQGVSVIYISHKIDEIMKICDEVTVLRDGKLTGCWPIEELNEDIIVNKMVGRELSNRYPSNDVVVGKERLIVKNLTSACEGSFKDINFSLHKGEILGIGGLVGSQRTELIESIYGLREIKSGSIYINDNKVVIKNPRDAISNGLALLTEERRATGLFPQLNLIENTIIANEVARTEEYIKRLFILDDNKRKKETQYYIEKLNVKSTGLKSKIQDLSGGNQQKVLLGRWLLTKPEILILDEPTRGIDVGAKYEIYKLMIDLAREGKSIIMVSSEMTELMGVANRIMVMCEGHLSGILDGATATDDQIMKLASSYKNNKGDK